MKESYSCICYRYKCGTVVVAFFIAQAEQPILDRVGKLGPLGYV